MQLEATFIKDVYLLKRHHREDDRGFFERLFCQEELKSILIKRSVRQINHTFTREEGVVRGLHFQHPPHAELKIVSCIRGSIFDVVVDLRKDSPTFLHYYDCVISANNLHSIVIPEGVAHGFQTLESNCEMLYMHTADYIPEAEGGINALDPLLNIRWPKKITNRSYRDTNQPRLNENYSGIEII